MPEQYSISWAKASESETPAPHCSTPSNAEQRLENESEKRTCTTRTNLRGHCPRVREKPIAFNYALRTHYDTLSDEVSNATGLDTGDETPVRQEFAHDADINVLLNKYNVDPRGRPIEFKEVDYTSIFNKPSMPLKWQKERWTTFRQNSEISSPPGKQYSTERKTAVTPPH